MRGSTSDYLLIKLELEDQNGRFEAFKYNSSEQVRNQTIEVPANHHIVGVYGTGL